MFKNMDFHRYVAKKDFCFQNTSFENHKLQIEIRKNATLLFMENELLWTKTMAYLHAFTCLSARLARGTCLHALHVPRAQHVRSTLGSLRFDDINDNAINQ